MSFGLTHSGAIARGLAYVPAADLRTWRGSANVTAIKPVQPTDNAAVAREQIRDQVMAERGVDARSLYDMSSQGRIRAEAAIMAEAARRAMQADNQARAEIRATGALVDLRV
jgi:hypothetical protein